MRFKYDEISPAGKRQYFLALGRVELDLLAGEAENALRYMPNVPELQEIRQRLHGIVKGLKQAQKVAHDYGDEGDRLPWKERKPSGQKGIYGQMEAQ